MKKKYSVEFTMKNTDGSLKKECATLVKANSSSEAKMVVVRMPNVVSVEVAEEV